MPDPTSTVSDAGASDAGPAAADVRLTEFSHGAGCGCKIAPGVLDQILARAGSQAADPRLLVGNAERDDAAVYDLGDGTCVISTTDFFMPIVDHPETFGRIAAANAMSDVWAMGGDPMMAIAILGWPIDKLAPEIAGRVLAGAREACDEAGIPLAGGHSIDSPEPIFGLAVTGRVDKAHLKKNGGAQVGDVLLLTKPLGVGILSTAQKKGKLSPEHADIAPGYMRQLNTVGSALGRIAGIHAMTDVTGFGLLGHLREMCDASGLTAEVRLTDVPRIAPEIVDAYLDAGCIPGGTGRNWASYGNAVASVSERARAILCDPQTSGGLLVAIDPSAVDEVQATLREHGISATPFATLLPRGTHAVTVVEGQ